MAIAHPRLAGRQRDDVLLRDRAAADLARVLAHHLPVWWHHLESRATLALELGVPFAIFGPRRARLAAAACFALFQLANAATANYGFFCYLAVVLNVFLLDDADVERAGRRLAGAATRPLGSGARILAVA